MAYVSVIDVTDTTATIEITGLDTSYFQKRATFYWGEISYSNSDIKTFTVSSSGSYQYTYTGLSQSTSYIFAVYIESMQGGTYYYEDEVDGSFATSGGGGGGEPRFIAYATNNNTDIYVNAYDMWTVDYDYIDYEISSGSYTDSYRVSSGSHTFEGVPSGTYTVEAWYIYNNRPYRIYSSEDESYITVVIGGGGGGSWTLSSLDLGIISSETSRTLYGMTGQTLYSWSVAFSTAGSVTFSCSGNADTMGWLSGYNQTSWDDSAGRPNNYLAFDDDSGSGNNFEITWTCDANTVYYLWFRTYSGDAYSENVTITISPEAAPATWSYIAGTDYLNISSDMFASINLSDSVGVRFAVSFTNSGTAQFECPSGANAVLYITDYNYGYDSSTGVPTNAISGSGGTYMSLTVVSGSTYYVWVRGSSASIHGNLSVLITAPSSAVWTYTLDSSITNPSSTVTRNYTLAQRSGYYMAVRFQISGTAVFYTEGDRDRKSVV